MKKTRRTKWVAFAAIACVAAIITACAGGSTSGGEAEKKASNVFKVYKNEGGATISTVHRNVIEQDGLYFKDIDGSGIFKPFDDWRLPPEERAAAYVKELTLEEKIAQLFIADWRMGKYPQGDHKPVLDESGTLDEAEFIGNGGQQMPGTTVLIKEWFSRHMILRTNPTAEDLTDWLNQLQAVAEECEHFIPVQVVSNSRNENDRIIFDSGESSAFALYPNTLGIAAAILGSDISVADNFADTVRREWNAYGLRKGYMYMADVVTDPRWQRTYGTFGESTELTTEIIAHIVPRIQGSDSGVTTDGVAMTTKHFPGGGARENGFDPHYALGQWNIYSTEDSLLKYHLPPFQKAIDLGTSSIMPYYAKPSSEKSAPQRGPNGAELQLIPFGFAYNRPFIQGLLRDQMGFKGYVNSDTGFISFLPWGAEALDVPERIGFAVTHAGVDLISGTFDNESALEAYERGKNGWYDEHPVPAGFTKDEIIITDESLDRAVTRTLTELFALGMFDDPFRSVEDAKAVASNQADWDNAMDAHRKSVVLLKDESGALPLTKEKTTGKSVYAECFDQNADKAAESTESLRALLKDDYGFELANDPAKADYAILLLTPSSGSYFSATPGYLELDICDGKQVPNVDDVGRPLAEMHSETTLAGAARIAEIASAVHSNGGKVIANVNVTLAWQLGNVEPYCDALLAGFDTYVRATLDAITGAFKPTGKLPLTLPRGDEVIAVNADGVCISPNDVPGYDKDMYIPDFLKDENGKAYAYRDATGNYYEYGFGL